MKSKIYLAGPLFTPLEREFNQRVAFLLERSFDVFLPQRDGELLPGADSRDVSALSKRIYGRDLAELDACHIIFAILDGRTIDEGVAFEIGYAVARGKKCIGYKSDSRVLLPCGDNPMIACALDARLSSEQEIALWVESESRQPIPA